MVSDTETNIWPNKLTRYEIARIVGARALQLSLGAPPLINPDELPVKDSVVVSIVELLRGLLPITIRRLMPNGEYRLIPATKLISSENRRYLETALRSWTLSTEG